MADLAFYASRDLSLIHWTPFIAAALERNPVILKATKEFDDIHLIKVIEEMPNESIYDGARAAQPDEIWNYQRGDGLEKSYSSYHMLEKSLSPTRNKTNSSTNSSYP